MDPLPQELEQTVPQAQKELSTAEQIPLDERPTEIRIAIPTQAYFLSGIRDFVVNLTKNLTGFSSQWAYRFQAGVDELCNNAIEHGSKAGEFIKITLISTKNKSLEVIVEDTGTGKDKITAEQLTALLQERRQMMGTQYLGFRGRGLPKIVGEWTDELIFENTAEGGIRVKVKKYLRKEEDKVISSQQNSPSHLYV
ncbi:ATP-binding protein [Candidatus Peregrinibacteria bacterium]|nr:MAG: ATP-binding protein [Candidatus Peregrinibacteria bacterium]